MMIVELMTLAWLDFWEKFARGDLCYTGSKETMRLSYTQTDVNSPQQYLVRCKRVE